MRGLISTELLRPRPTALGHIKIGGKGEERPSKSGGTFRLPIRFDHFRVTKRIRGPDENFELDREIMAKLGEKPMALDIRLMFDTPEESFFSQMQQYRGRTKIWQCDGETARNVKTGEESECRKAAGAECKCKPYGRFAVILEAAPTFGGFYIFRTTSWESVNNIQTALTLFHEEFGSLRGLPLRLVLYPAEDTYTEGGKDKTSTSHKVGLVLRCSVEEAGKRALEFHKTAALQRGETLKMLSAGVAEEILEAETEDEPHIGDEFHPEGEEAGKSHDLNVALGITQVDDEEPEEVEAEVVEEPEPEDVGALAEERPLAEAEEAGAVEETGEGTDYQAPEKKESEAEPEPAPEETIEPDTETKGPNTETNGPKAETKGADPETPPPAGAIPEELAEEIRELYGDEHSGVGYNDAEDIERLLASGDLTGARLKRVELRAAIEAGKISAEGQAQGALGV